MTPKEAKQVIDRAYAALERACERSGNVGEAQMLLEKAYVAARDGEKLHRKHAWDKTERPRNSVETAARYFVLRWFYDPVRIGSARAAVMIRADALYGAALRELLGDVESLMGHLKDHYEEVEYVEHIAAAIKEGL